MQRREKKNKTKPAVKGHGVIEKQACSLKDASRSVHPKGCLLCAQQCLPPWTGQRQGQQASRAGNGTGAWSRSLRARQGRPHLRKAPGSPCSPKPHVLRSISRHENAVKYFWMFPAPSGISGAASCWEQCDCTCDSDTARSNATPGKHQVQASIFSAKTPLNEIFKDLQKRQLLFQFIFQCIGRVSFGLPT